MRDLRFSALNRPATPLDMPPREIMSADVRALTRRLTTVESVTIYLAAGHDFACLAVDGTASVYNFTTTCLLNFTIANDGLSTVINSDGPFDPLLIVALPDGSTLVPPTPDTLTKSNSLAVFRRSDLKPIYLQTLSRSLIPLHDQDTVTFDKDGHAHKTAQPMCR